ncbi:uncharacterized protein LOC132299635 isoform X2 [Cornus florida]|uniref:uncharacterized protein LOC132299635 isoform X2 n=1 Tax=Cornus florida TaxID=4283 RepID=UPI0028A1614B|nr:uncharacterized protein LOC132299635 isoform X2 [Cornus florida]
MSAIRNGDGAFDGKSIGNLREITEEETVRVSIDLVAATRRHVGFLRLVAESHCWLHNRPTITEAVRRYEELWMPLMSELTVGPNPPLIIPPLDIEWVWYCHTMNPVSYREYCESRFSKLIGKPTIFDEENQEYAYNRCREIWVRKYPSEPFENELDSDDPQDSIVTNQDLLDKVSNHQGLYSKFSEPYMTETVYIITAKQRYKGFLHMIQRYGDGCSRLVPASDILLMWSTHQSYPTVYAADLEEIDEDMGKVVGLGEAVKEGEVEETKKLWERVFDQPYEKAGGAANGGLGQVKPWFSWEVMESDVNTKYKSMVPRFLLELNSKMKPTQEDISHDFLRLRVVRCHRELKIDKLLSNFPLESWQKAWHLYCEFGTRGVVLELRHHGGFFFRGSSLRDTVTFLWNDLLRAPSLSLERQVNESVRAVTSITPPAQASYLLKCVPDRVTDDSGAMISDVILRMNQYRPQEGRWLSRTVLDHASRECFVVRMRVGGGFWRRGGETPLVVKWEDRIIEIREGGWSYVAGSIGRAPERVVGTAIPREASEHWNASWYFSTGDELMIQWELSTLVSGLRFSLKNQTSPDSTVKLLKGRKMQYKAKKFGSEVKEDEENKESAEEREEDNEDEEGFVTLVRTSEDNPTGKATALINWKLLVVEFLPEEDAVFVLLLCISILRSVSEMKKEDVGSLLIRRRVKEAKLGTRDWGSVILHPSSCSPFTSSPHLRPWYWNAKAVMASDGEDHIQRQPALNYSAAEGGDKLYKRGIIA